MSYTQKRERYSLLDFSRFVAALTVVLYHYQHFLNKSELEKLYWYPVIEIFIAKGHLAVPFFWILSGFVIASSYRLPKWKGVGRFLLYRFARLYPLHLATLLLVGVLQFISLGLNGKPLIYTNHDFTNFFVHLFFLSGFTESFDSKSFSYNAPIWSVSLELMCYCAFALLMAFSILRLTTIWCVLSSIVLLDIFSSLPDQLIRVNLFFFTGVVIHLVCTKRSYIHLFSFWLLVCSGICITNSNFIVAIQDAFPKIQVFQYRYNFLFVAVILILLQLELRVKESVAARFINLGNLSYSMYLLHVPVQLIVLLIIPVLGANQDKVLGSGVFIVLFVLVLLALSRLVYQHFEEPCRRRIRELMSDRNQNS